MVKMVATKLVERLVQWHHHPKRLLVLALEASRRTTAIVRDQCSVSDYTDDTLVSK